VTNSKIEIKLSDSDIYSNVWANFCGILDENLRIIEKKLSIKINRQNYYLTLIGAKSNLLIAKKAIPKLIAKSDKALDQRKINLILMETQMQEKNKASPKLQNYKKSINIPNPTTENQIPEFSLMIGQKNIKAYTPNQYKYLQDIHNQDLVFGIGPAGTGKTYLAVASAVNALEQSMVQRIVLTRPALEAGERLGFLPGTLAEKVDPYLRPVYDALYDTLGIDKFHRYMNEGIIEIAPLAFMRGRTLNQSFIILDEAQNTTSEQMKMLLTRIGFSSKTVVNGDLTQTDLPNGKISGLEQAWAKLKRINGISFINFDHNDVVRHPLVARIIKAYDK